MTKPFELIYSQQSTDFKPGAAYSNPRFFSTPRSGVSKVFLVGNWPNIQAAYEALGVPVEQLDPALAIASPDAGKAAAPPALTPVAVDLSSVVIPEDWRDLNYNRPKPDRDITQRAIAAQLSREPILNKEQAVAAIEAELQRRENAAQACIQQAANNAGPGDVEETAANGLTRREMNADFEAAGVEVDPELDIEALAAKHAEIKAAK